MSATPSLPAPKVIHVDTRGAIILSEESPEVGPARFRPICADNAPHQTRDSRGIYLPNYIEPVSHIAVDVRLLPSRALVRAHTRRARSAAP